LLREATGEPRVKKRELLSILPILEGRAAFDVHTLQNNSAAYGLKRSNGKCRKTRERKKT
jgi:hypothetical protein